METLRQLVRYSEDYKKYKPVHEKYTSIHWNGQKEKFRVKHSDELDAFYEADRFLKTHSDGHSPGELKKELAGLEEVTGSHGKTIDQCKSDLNELKSVRYCVSYVMADEKAREQSNERRKEQATEQRQEPKPDRKPKKRHEYER